MGPYKRRDGGKGAESMSEKKGSRDALRQNEEVHKKHSIHTSKSPDRFGKACMKKLGE